MKRVKVQFEPLMLLVAKSSLMILKNLAGKNINGRTFDGEMSIRTLPSNLHQIFCKIILDSIINVKMIMDPDDNFLEEILSINWLRPSRLLI